MINDILQNKGKEDSAELETEEKNIKIQNYRERGYNER